MRTAVPTLDGADVAQIAGDLRFPPGDGPFPAVVMLHGCGGVRSNAYRWARHLEAHGYATLVLDSFGPRRVSEICTDFRRVSVARRIADARAALGLLMRHPSISPDRVAVMGFSNGAVVALDTAETLRSTGATERFSAVVALYPECRKRAPFYDVPVQILIGDQDDWTLAGSCRQLAVEASSVGRAIELTIYPGAAHAFDDGTAGEYLPMAVNMNSPTGYGASYRGDRRTRELAERDVVAFLGRTLGAASAKGGRDPATR